MRGELAVLLVGIDCAERHHDVCVMAPDGQVLACERITDGVAGVARLHELIARHASDPAQVVVGIETDRGLLVGALVAAGYQVVAVNPLAASRYRERHTISRAKSDRADARMLADLVRTDRHHHRQVAGDSGLAEAIKVLARGHQQLVWARQRQANLVRSALRAFYPAALAAFGSDPGGRDAVAVLGLAPTLSWVGRCPRPSWQWRCAAPAGAARSRPAPPPSRRHWPASSWKPHRCWPLPTARS
jgi:transposase